jgi:hypothetical protein
MIGIIILCFFMVLKFVIFFFKYMDYWAVGLIPFFVSDVVFSASLFEADIHIVFKILIFLAPCVIWWFLSNRVRIGEFYPLKWIGAIICGFFIALVAYGVVEKDIIWTITIGVIGTIVVGISRYVPLDFG